MLVASPIERDLLEVQALTAHEFLAHLMRSMAGPHALKTNAGNDFQADVMGGGAGVGDSGTATATSATSLTDSGKAWVTNTWIGHIVVTANTTDKTYGVVTSNTGTVLTVDRWYTPATPGGSAAPTPGATSPYVILPGGAPGWYMAITTDATAPAATDTALASELATAGLGRKIATYSHSAGVNSYALSTTYTQTDSTARTIAKLGVLNASSGGRLIFETAIPNPPVLAAINDSLTPTETVTT